MNRKTAVIIGAGPAGLTAAYELQKNILIHPLVFEEDKCVGGLSRTVSVQGNRMDIGGHRYFSNSDDVMRWWFDILPSGKIGGNSSDLTKHSPVMIINKRQSRILYGGYYYDYPLSLSSQALLNFGFMETLKIGASYMRARLFPVTPITTLEDFMINRFGKALYTRFFRDYTRKVWGVYPSEMPPEWGMQRIRNISFARAISHALHHKETTSRGLNFSVQNSDVASFANRFVYPCCGAGQMWEEVARRIGDKGGAIQLRSKVVAMRSKGKRIEEVSVLDESSGEIRTVKGDYFVSSMPMRDLVHVLGDSVPGEVATVADGLEYRDLLLVCMLLRRLSVRGGRAEKSERIPSDQWLYIQEKSVQLGRICIFNNWSPHLMIDPENTVGISLEYYCQENDGLWNMKEADMVGLATTELQSIGMIAGPEDVLHGQVLRIRKAYPSYRGTYRKFSVVRDYLDQYENLFLIGRNGQHRYNNMDHSVLTAMKAVEAIDRGHGKENIWAVNTEEKYNG